MTEPPQGPPLYPDDPYGSFQPPPPVPPAPPAPPKTTLTERVGARALRRPEPRFGVALAGIGVLLVIFGILIWSTNYVSTGGSDGGSGSESRKLLGIALSLVAVAVGYAVAIRARTGPLVNAGVAASALGIPVLMGFLSYSSGDFPPVSFDAVAIVSILVWLASYLFVPVVRGHVFYLGAAAVTLWIYVLDKIESHLFSFGFFIPSITVGSGDTSFEPSSGFSVDFNTIAAISMLFGLGYYVTAAFLDRRGRSGAGVAFALAGFPATVVGLIAAAVNMPQVGFGFFVIGVGVAIALVAGRGRRFTMWVWTFAVVVGVFAILEDLTPNNDTVAGISFIVIGLIAVALAAVYAVARNEPDETVGTVTQ